MSAHGLLIVGRQQQAGKGPVQAGVALMVAGQTDVARSNASVEVVATIPVGMLPTALAANETAVRQELRRQGVTPRRVRKQSMLFRKQGKVTTADIAIFSRQLATMMTAGIPLVQSFDIVGAGHENPAMQKLILAIKGDVEGGAVIAIAQSLQLPVRYIGVGERPEDLQPFDPREFASALFG